MNKTKFFDQKADTTVAFKYFRLKEAEKPGATSTFIAEYFVPSRGMCFNAAGDVFHSEMPLTSDFADVKEVRIHTAKLDKICQGNIDELKTTLTPIP